MPVIEQEVMDRCALYNADCMEVMPELDSESIDLSVYSPPFPELYQYSNDPRDMTNCTSYDESIEQYRYVVQQVARLTKPGRLTAVHCTDLKRGQYNQRDFPGDVIRVHEEYGFHFFCRITIWKDPWHFARRTRMITLRHKQLVEDSSLCRTAPPDYVCVFRKAGKNEVPITHSEGMKFYAGDTPIPPEIIRKYGSFKGEQKENILSHWIWRRYASPVWMDIRRKRLLPYRSAKDKPEEKHVCPLQMDVVDRCLFLWSNPNETILTPFMGIGSEAYGAIVNGRKAIGIELKPSYYRQAVRNVSAAVKSWERADSPIFTGEDSLEDEQPEDDGDGEDGNYDDDDECQDDVEGA